MIAQSTTYVVNPEGTGDYPTIQAAIDAAVDGDAVELTDGTFTGTGNHDIDFAGKAITVRSVGRDPQHCIIDCENSGRGFHFHSGEGSGSVVEGVTITNGDAPLSGVDEKGGAILCADGSSPTVSHCRLVGNWAYLGAGIACTDVSSPTISDCSIASNAAETGCGIYCYYHSSPDITNCTISENSASRAAGMVCIYFSSPTVSFCTFSGNVATQLGGGIACTYSSYPALINCTLFDNSAPEGSGLHLRWSAHAFVDNTIIAFGIGGEAVCGLYGGDATLSCCDLFGNAGGDWVGCIEGHDGFGANFSADPLFCEPAQFRDLTLYEDSPCLPGNHPEGDDCGLIGAKGVGCTVSSVPRSVVLPGMLRVFPNPTAGPITIDFALPAAGWISAQILDASGRVVRDLFCGTYTHVYAGDLSLTWDGRDDAGRLVASGVYLVSMRADTYGKRTKVLVLQ
jgi:parallel beta-helix repeat protein